MAGTVRRTADQMLLSGQVAVVTGAGRGIGRATVHTLARAGASVVAAARTLSDLQTLEAEARAFGGSVVGVTADVSVESDAERLMTRTLDKHGQIDILVNNAGLTLRAPVAEILTSAWLEMLAANLSSTFYCTRAVLPSMIARRQGKIVNVSSRGGRVARRLGAAYSAAKFGVMGFGEAAAQDLKAYGISVSAVLPGPTATPTRARNAPDEDPETILQPSDVAEVILFLATRPPHVIVPEISVFPRATL